MAKDAVHKTGRRHGVQIEGPVPGGIRLGKGGGLRAVGGGVGRSALRPIMIGLAMRPMLIGVRRLLMLMLWCLLLRQHAERRWRLPCGHNT